MNEWPIFLSYRDFDGAELAWRLRESLHGRSTILRVASLDIPVTLSVYFDRASSAVPDWKESQLRELERARAFLVVCSPGTMRDFGDDDWFYAEIRWWLEHRGAVAPILASKDDVRWIPPIIKRQWPNLHVVRFDAASCSVLALPEQTEKFEVGVQAILSSVWSLAEHGDGIESGPLALNALFPDMAGLYMWEKDLNFRYVRANDNYARAAGYDSAEAMIGKSDDDMPWRALADFFRAGDQGVFSGTGPVRLNVPEKEIMVDRAADILVTENQLRDHRGECVGLAGYFVDITGRQFVAQPPRTNNASGLCLGPQFDNEYLSPEEVLVFKALLKVQTVDRIATALSMSRKSVDAHIQSIKRKLQCVTDGDIIATAIRAGLPLTLFGPQEG